MRSTRSVGLLAFLAFAGLAWAGQSRGDQYALLVAVAAYPKLTPLNYTRDDLSDFRKTLLASGFRDDHVVLMHDQLTNPDLAPTLKNIRTQLDLLLGKAGADDSVIVAFSGHGVDSVKEKHSYFCPLDADLNNKGTLLGLDDLYDKLKTCQAARKLLLVDACRDDPALTQGKALEKLSLESLTRPQECDTPEGIVALFSCSEREKSWESPELKHGVFFYYFLEGWRGAAAHDGKLTLDDVISYTAAKTQAYARDKLKETQRPQRKNEFSGVWVLNDSVISSPETGPETTKPGDPLTLKGRGEVFHLAYSGDGKYLAGGRADGAVQVWDAATGRAVVTLSGGGPVVGVALDAHGRFAAAGADDKAVRVWDCKTGNLLWTKADLPERPRGVAFSPDGESVAVAAGAVWVLASATGALSWHYEDSAVFQAVAYSPAGERLAAGSLGGRVVVWKANGEPVKSVQAHADGGVGVLAYSADGAWLASGSRDATAKVFDAATLRPHYALKGHDGGVSCFVFTADGQRLGAAAGKTIHVWDLSTGKETAAPPNLGGNGLAACFGPDGKHIAVASPDKTVRVLGVDLSR